MENNKIMEIIIPNQGLTLTEVEITIWHKRIGEIVEKGDVLFEFESDKATIEFDSPVDGVLSEIVSGEGVVVPIGGVVARISINQ